MKILLKPLLKFVYALLLTLINIPFVLLHYIWAIIWEFSHKRAVQHLEHFVDFAGEELLPYNSPRGTYKTIIHAIWNIQT